MGFFDIDFSDVAVGAIEAVDVGIQQSIKKYENDKTRLRDIKYTSKKAAYDKFDTQVTDNAKKIKEAAAVFGGNVDAVYSLIESEGSLDAAVEAANLLKKQENTLGINPLETLGLAESSASGVTVSQLARYSATPIKTQPVAKAEDVATGFMRFIPGAGERALESIDTGVSADLAAAGYEDMGSTEDILSTMPEATANKLKPYMLGRVADPQQEMNRLINIQANLMSKGRDDEANSLKEEINRLNVVVASTETQTYTPNMSITTKGIISSKFSNMYGLGGNFSPDGSHISGTQDRQLLNELDRVSDYAEGAIANAVQDGMTYDQASRMVSTFVRDGQMFVYKKDDDDFGPGEFIAVEGQPLHDIEGLLGEGVEKSPVFDQSTTSEAEVGDAATAGSANEAAPDNNIARLQQMDQNSTEAETLRAKILRSQGGAEKLAAAGL